MKIHIDTEQQILVCETKNETTTHPLYSDAAFGVLSQQWLKVGWNQKYPYTFSWMGRPIIQLPEDILRAQEVIYRIKPDVLVETGVAHGGSLVLYASLFRAMGKGRVIGVDVEIRPHNRVAIESHELSPSITLVEGDSISPQTAGLVRSLIGPGESVMVILDSCHTKEHVAAELRAYESLVTLGSYIVATDGSMKDLHDVPRGRERWSWDHPTAAAMEFAAERPEFLLEQPKWPFNESSLEDPVTLWPGAWLRRVR